MDATVIAAWWGAVVATFVFLWDIYKHYQHGPKIEYQVSTDMQILGGTNVDRDLYTTMRLRNNGDMSTTIETVGLTHFKTLFHKLFNIGKKNLFVNSPGNPHPLPYEIKPGGIWDGKILQDEEYDKLSTTGILTCHVFCSHSDKPISRKIKRKIAKI